jgi:hypothetical protein
MTTLRIHELECLGFEWKSSISQGKVAATKSSLDDGATCSRERAVEPPEFMQQTQEDFSRRDIGSNQVDVAFVPGESDWNGEVHLACIPGRPEEI